MAFADHFSRQSAAYAAFRPGYPAALFDYLASLAFRHDVAWDCATGSGQAARGLAPHFTRVIATDASTAQLAQAAGHPGVEFRVGTAEASSLPARSADLVTVAQALHWFDLDRFYAEVRRVLVNGGALAVWTYDEGSLDDEALNEVFLRFGRVAVGPYWPPERRLVGAAYTQLPFPFTEVHAPAFEIECTWTLPELAGYLRSWSATARYVAAHGRDPVADVEAELRPLWGAPEARHRIRWPLTVRAGRVR